MSHCPGFTLEDWLTDWYRLVDEDGLHGTGIRRIYADQLILNKEQFKKLVEIHEPYRERVEYLLEEYDEEINGSWRDYCGCFEIPKDIEKQADAYIDELRKLVPKTKGIG